MGSDHSKPTRPPANVSTFRAIPDSYETYEQLQDALRRAGLESSNLILAIDYTKSNTWTGQRSFQNKCLHEIDPNNQVWNPYQSVIHIMGRTLEAFDDDKLIPAFGFGDATTGGKACFPFLPNGGVCQGFNQVLMRYNQITPEIALSGPTNFAPVIHEAIRICQAQRSYHILVIVADGQVTNERETIDAIVAASNFPLSIIMVGVGDGPWDMMERFDDQLPSRRFDNFQFVEYNKMLRLNRTNPEVGFATAALMEVPGRHCHRFAIDISSLFVGRAIQNHSQVGHVVINGRRRFMTLTVVRKSKDRVMPPQPPTPSVLTPPKPIELLDELLGSVLLLASLVYLLLVELTRRRVLSLHQFTFCLASVGAIATLGGFLEHNVPNEMLELSLFGQLTQTSSIFQLRYAPLAVALTATIVFIVYISSCGCHCCCLLGGPDGSLHQLCYVHRFRSAVSVYSLACFVLFIVLGMRLNARMRLSAIKPVGGSLHWQLLQSPLCLGAIHTCSLLLVLLKDILYHADTCKDAAQTKSPPLPPQTGASVSPTKLVQPALLRPRSTSRDPVIKQATKQEALAQSLQSIQRSRRPLSASSDEGSLDSRPHSASTESEPILPRSKQIHRISPVRRRAVSEAEAPLPPRRRAQPIQRTPSRTEGDISNLISSESESDEDVIVPSAIRQFTSEYAAVNRLVLTRRPSKPEDADPWTLCVDEKSGASYYYNHETGESAWERPVEHTKWE
ncbi:hypothetical protein AC1031_007236 [Aphanomyces cochlioides]|nr:hypothetical protein AC1031_007236 [Aphanomyces cochlioides]